MGLQKKSPILQRCAVQRNKLDVYLGFVVNNTFVQFQEALMSK